MMPESHQDSAPEILFALALYKDGQIAVQGKLPTVAKVVSTMRMIADSLEAGTTVLTEMT